MEPTIEVKLTYETASNVAALIHLRFREQERSEAEQREALGDEEFDRLRHIYEMPDSTRRGYQSFLDQYQERWPDGNI